MSDQSTHRGIAVGDHDALAHFVEQVEHHLREDNISEVARLLEADMAAAWYGFEPARTAEILQQISTQMDSSTPILNGLARVLTATSAGQFDDQEYLASVNSADEHEMFMLSVFRMADLRLYGRSVEALEQAENLEGYLGKMRLLLDPQDGAELQTVVQIGICAMLAGDFTRALTSFTHAQMLSLIPRYAFLTRDALVKSAVIHACFGNSTTARSLLQRADKIAPTSSWVEAHIDAHRDFAAILTSLTSHEEALDQLEAIGLHDIGEMWPFYIIAVHRLLEASGYHDELDHRLEMFDAMPFPVVDKEGFSGSVIPLKRAMIAMKTGREAVAQAFLSRSDPKLPYTRLIETAGHIYAGRTQQALHQATRLKNETRGFRLLEIRRLSLLAAAQYQSEAIQKCVETLTIAAGLPRGLSASEIELFSPETRELAIQRVAIWPQDTGGPSAFLTGLPKPGHALTEREVEIIGQLAQGYRRTDIAKNLYISLNTLKTQLRSIYRKLEVSAASDAVVGAQRRGII